MTNNVYTVLRNMWLVSIALILLFLYAPKYVHAELTSSQYTLTAYGFGQGNATLSSPNFTLTTSNNSSVNLSTFIRPPVTPGNSGSRGGSRGRSELVLDTIQINTGGGIGQTIAQVVRAQDSIPSERNEEDDVSIEDVGTTLTPVNTIGNGGGSQLNLAAALIGARDTFREIFKERSARVILFGGVLLILWYVRTYTVVGRKYRPF